MNRRNFTALALAATTVLAAGVAPAFTADDIKVGVIVAQSPPGSVVQGEQILAGIDIARGMINAEGGVLGRNIQTIVEDGQGVPEKGRAAAEKLITSDKVVALTGEHQSSNVLAEIEVTHRYHIPYVNSNGWSDAIREKGYEEVFNPANWNSNVAESMAKTLAALKVKSVVAFAENTDYGIGQAKILGEKLKKLAPDIDYKYSALDRAAKDFAPAVLPLRADPPDVVANIMLPPAAYMLINQLYEQGVAPSKQTILYDGAGVVDYPDFWSNVGDAGVNILAFGLYHPKMNLPPLAAKVADAYAKTHDGNAPSRLVFQAFDSLYLIKNAIEKAGSTDPDAVIKAMQATDWTGSRGEITFDETKGNTYQQWVDMPTVTYQVTAKNQAIEDTPILEQPGQNLDPSKVVR